MGGSGGGFFPDSRTPGDLVKKTREAEADARSDRFKTEVAECLNKLLVEINDRDEAATQRLLDDVQRGLAAEGIETEDILFGGSVAKHTFVSGLSDVDALVLFDRDAWANRSPEEVKELLADHVRDRYGRGAVSVGALAVTVVHEGTTVQLLPALRFRQQFQIASSDGLEWSRIAPRRFAAALTRANKKLGAKLVPCIKLAKAIMASLPERHRLTGYHTEAMAINVFREYEGARTSHAMLRYFFDNANTHVLKPIRDASGQSVHVDEYLGSENSLRRRIVGNALARIARRIRNADGARSSKRWQELFGVIEE